MTSEKKGVRTYERFDKKAKAFLYFNYDFTSKIDFLDAAEMESDPANKYPACSKNVSAEGLCFTSFKKLKAGETVRLAMYLKEDVPPIEMEGEVKWSQVVHPGFDDEEEKDVLFDTGIRLLSVEGKPVPDSIYYDDTYHVIWSNALESILGSCKKTMNERKEEDS